MNFTQLQRWFELDRAVAFLAATRSWQFLSAPVTLLLLSWYFSGETLGDYYSFIGLLNAQSFIDLGLSSIILLLASHEHAGPSDCRNSVEGDDRGRQRLGELFRFANAWYRVCSTVFIIVLGTVGLYVLNHGTDDSAWNSPLTIPWLLCVATNGVSLRFLPSIALLEGCNAVVAVNRMRFLQATSGSVVVWVCVVGGAGLWTLAISNAVRLVWEFYLIRHCYGGFFKGLAQGKGRTELNWRKEIWPLQWRIAIQSVGGYLSSWFIVPAVRALQGKTAAGQVGMTWQVLTNIQSVSLTWVQTKLPALGKLASGGAYADVRRGIWKSGALSIVIVVVGVGGVFAGLLAADWAGFALSSNFVSKPAILLFALSLLAVQIATIQHAYVRLFKRDPFLLQNLGATILSASVIWWCGSTYSLFGLAAGYAMACWLYSVPLSTLVVIRHNSVLKHHEKASA